MSQQHPAYYFQRQTQIVNTGYGANNISVSPGWTFPLFNFFGHGGILPSFHWSILQGQQLWVNPVKKIIGNPGIQNGQMIGQPQIDSRGINGT